MQIHTGGILKAMPHAVVTPRNLKGVSRNSMAIFMEPTFDTILDVPKSRKVE
jgi:isopenicillin N synthase-like dioxygenase